MCNLYEDAMSPELVQTLKDHFSLVGTAYFDLLSGRNGPQKVYPNYEAPVIRSLTEPNGIVEPIHDKAMPVLLRTPDQAEQWLKAPPEEALQLQKPVPDDAIVMLLEEM